jgi:hypothetical protein
MAFINGAGGRSVPSPSDKSSASEPPPLRDVLALVPGGGKVAKRLIWRLNSLPVLMNRKQVARRIPNAMRL